MIFVRVSLLKKSTFQLLLSKYKHKDTHWSVIAKKKSATNRALEHFDDFYKKVYDSTWPSIRQGLLGHRKYVAVVNYYGDNEETMTELENGGALNMRTMFELEGRYIKERRESARRSKVMDDVYRLDEQIEKRTSQVISEYKDRISESSDEVVAEKVVVNKTVQTEEKSVQKPTFSVAESMKKAQFDFSRIITAESAGLSSALYEFVPASRIKGKEDWIPETQHYKYYESSNEFSVQVEKEYELHFPEHLNVYGYEQSNSTSFPSPKKCSTGVYNYYLLDGASVLPVLALGLQPGDRVLDMCCAPGGKSYVAIQTLYPDVMLCNDLEYSRVNRIQNVLNQYLYDLKDKWLSTGRVKLTQENGLVMSYEGYNRILVDVPCTNDRHSLHENDNNWFKGARTKERLQLPETQAALLTNALKMVSVGGSVVYSTCSLSPIQNDGVVNMALRKIWEETNIELVVKDLSPALKVTRSMFRYADQKILKYGHLIVPYLPQNYGPMYFCKIERKK